jgi:hypothetical protein
MALTINAPDLEQRISEAAASRGLSAEEYAVDILRGAIAERGETNSQDTSPGPNLAEALKDFVGIYNVKVEPPMSENCGQQFTEYLLEKQKNGNL